MNPERQSAGDPIPSDCVLIEISVAQVAPVSFPWEWGMIALLALMPVTVVEVTKRVRARLRPPPEGAAAATGAV